MTDSHDPIHRLIEADPVGRSPRAYPDADLLVRRAVTATTRPRIGVAFRAKVASAVLGASLLTGVGITALQESAPSLPVLALSSSPSTTNASDSKVAGSMLRPLSLTDYRFDGSRLVALPESAPVWKVTPLSGLQEFHQIARALGLEGPVTTTVYESGPQAATADTTYSLTDPNRGTLAYSIWSGSGLGSWWFNLDATVVTSTTNSGSSASSATTERQYQVWAKEFVSSLGLGDEYSEPDVYLYDNAEMGTSGASASFTLLLDGLRTSIGLYVNFDSSGHVTSASGSLGHFERVGNYPLTGVDEGVTRLQQQNDANLASTSDINPSQASDTGSSADSSAGVAIDVTPSVPPTVVTVELTTAEIQLQMATVGGDTYLIPYYVYGGSANSQTEDAGSWDGTWTVVAVSSKYVTIDEPQVMPMAAR